jgi:hypothetical protein
MVAQTLAEVAVLVAVRLVAEEATEVLVLLLLDTR